jgi:arsenate reductase
VGKRLHIGFPDPAKATGTDAEKMTVFRNVRDDIQARFKELYEKELRVH